MKNMELLAPAGDIESFYAAINNGADAVYLGLQSFNARDKAANFTLDNIRDIVKHAHIHGVKVYLTLNTLIGDDEFESLLDNVRVAVNSKVDAFIVQDLGVARVLKKAFPNIVLHASTQMGIHNLDGALVAESLGFSRVVVSRETTAKDIELIRNNTSLEIEYFVQGALCVAFSGACYLSSLEHGESGNRGRCLQLCRLPYTARCGDVSKSGYLLSTADLSLIDKLDYLASIGVDSLKIEGRLRRSAYVAGTVKTYRQALNKVKCDDILPKLFYRGEYNSGHYLSPTHSHKIINSRFQNHRGVKIGKVNACTPFKNLYKININSTNHNIQSGDGLKFVYNDNELSMGVGNVDKLGDNYIVYSKIQPKVGSAVYLTMDSKLEKNLLSAVKKIEINAHFVAKVQEYPQLTLQCGQVSVTAHLPTPCEIAKTQGITQQDIDACLSKTKDTPFTIENVSVNLDNIFLAKSQLNALRRQAVDLLTDELIYQHENSIKATINADFILDFPSIQKCQHSYILIDEDGTSHAKDLTKRIVLAPKIWDKTLIYNTVTELLSLGQKKVYLNIPTVLNSHDVSVLDDILDNLSPDKIGLVVNNIAGLNYASQYEIVGGYALNICNSFAVEYLNSLGIEDYCNSIEDMFSLDGISYVGKPTVMCLKHCPYKTLCDYQDCSQCKFDNTSPLTLTMQSGKTLTARRVKLADCTFELVSSNSTTAKNVHTMLDLRK